MFSISILISKIKFLSSIKAALWVAFLLFSLAEANPATGVTLKSSLNGMDNSAQYDFARGTAGIMWQNAQITYRINHAERYDFNLHKYGAYLEVRHLLANWESQGQARIAFIDGGLQVADTSLPLELQKLQVKHEAWQRDIGVRFLRHGDRLELQAGFVLRDWDPHEVEAPSYVFADSLRILRGWVQGEWRWGATWILDLKLHSLSGYWRMQGLRQDELGDQKRFAMLRSGFDQWGAKLAFKQQSQLNWKITGAYNNWLLQIYPTESISNGSTFTPANLLTPSLSTLVGQTFYQQIWNWWGQAKVQHISLGGTNAWQRQNVNFKPHLSYHYIWGEAKIVEKQKSRGFLGAASAINTMQPQWGLHATIIGLNMIYRVPFGDYQRWTMGVEKWQPLSLRSEGLEFIIENAAMDSAASVITQTSLRRWGGGWIFNAGLSWEF